MQSTMLAILPHAHLPPDHPSICLLQVIRFYSKVVIESQHVCLNCPSMVFKKVNQQSKCNMYVKKCTHLVHTNVLDALYK